MPSKRILCQEPRRDDGSKECARWLATLDGMWLVIKCPRCRGERRVPLGEIVDWVLEEAERAKEVLGGRAEQVALDK